jgi:two-component system sensor histidine kinase GlrK
MSEHTIFQRLALGYLAIFLIVFALGTYTILRLGQLNRITRSISAIDAETIRISNRLRNASLSQRGFEEKFIVSGDTDFFNQFSEIEKYIQQDVHQLSILVNTPDKKALIAEVKESHNKYVLAVQEEERLMEAGGKYSQNEYQERKKDLVNKTTGSLEKLTGISRADIDEKIESSRKIGSRATRVTAILAITAIVMAILIALFNARTIDRPILTLIKGTRRISEGKFDNHLTIPSPPEIRELANAFNLMCDRLKKIDEMKADLISHVSHELRTPLTVIREAANMLSPDTVGESAISSEKHRRLLAIIREECEILIGSVNRILDLSRMNAGMIDYNIDKYSLCALIEKSVSKIEPLAEKKEINLDVKIDESLPLVDIDPEKMCQVLDNLLGNALKFTAKHGSVTITASLRNKETAGDLSDKGKGVVEVSVLDTGCGIAEENIPEIYDKFKMFSGKGTGLGLYIARQIVIAHGGNIWVKTEQGKGTTFSFTVPVS